MLGEKEQDERTEQECGVSWNEICKDKDRYRKKRNIESGDETETQWKERENRERGREGAERERGRENRREMESLGRSGA